MAPTGINSLPPELLAQVFSSFPDHLHWEALQPCALVCRAWRDLAQAALFSRVELVDDRMAELWLASPARHRHTTRSLWLESEEEYFLRLKLGLRVLRMCPGLVSLVVRDSEEDGQSDGGYEWCHSPNAWGVTELRIVYPEHFPIDSDPLPQRLRQLSLDLSAQVSARTIQNIFASSIDSLTTLRLENLDEPDSAQHLGSFLANNPLTNLRTLVLHGDIAYGVVPNITSCVPSLSAIAVYAQGHWDFAADAITAIEAIATPTLQALSFLEVYNTSPTTFQTLIHLLGHCKGLSRLSLPTVSKAALEGPEGLALLDECEERSIAFYCRYGYL